MSASGVHWIEHDLVPGVRAISTLRGGSAADFGGDGSGPQRDELIAALGGDLTPRWMKQVHGNDCIVLERSEAEAVPEADAAVTRVPGLAAAVLTADCLPVLLASRDGAVVAAIHAGWRGLASGVIAAAVQRMDADPATLVGVFGPAIGQGAYEVGPEVRDACLCRDPAAAVAFRAGRGDRWHADLYRLAQQQLRGLGIAAPPRPDWCTRTDSRFHSWRRDGLGAGRMAHLVWMTTDGRSTHSIRRTSFAA